jgi:hypothetical protein
MANAACGAAAEEATLSGLASFFQQKVIVVLAAFDAIPGGSATDGGTREAMSDHAATAKKYAELAARVTDPELADAYRNLAQGYELLARGTELLQRHSLAQDEA